MYARRQAKNLRPRAPSSSAPERRRSSSRQAPLEPVRPAYGSAAARPGVFTCANEINGPGGHPIDHATARSPCASARRSRSQPTVPTPCAAQLERGSYDKITAFRDRAPGGEAKAKSNLPRKAHAVCRRVPLKYTRDHLRAGLVCDALKRFFPGRAHETRAMSALISFALPAWPLPRRSRPASEQRMTSTRPRSRRR